MSHATMPIERLDLPGKLRARYFAPVAFCGYLFLLCCAIVVTAAFLKNLGEAVAVTAVGVFGMVLACGLGALVLRLQLRELNYLVVATLRSARQNYARVRALALDQGWTLTREEPDGRLEARTPNTMFQEGEIIAVRFRDQQVLVASICNPEVGFSLTGRDHCRTNRNLVRDAVQATADPQSLPS